MFKKALKVAATFGLLLAGYVGYVQVFAVVAARVKPSRPVLGAGLVVAESKTKREAIALAAAAFGRDHWSADRDLAVRYYNAERGYWMYAREFERLNDGKQLRFKPFAFVWKSRDGKALKTALGNEAVFNLDQPLGLTSKPGGTSLHVVTARIEGDVRLRDDKATPADLSDDLKIGPMTYIEYDEPTLQIRSESDVTVEDRDMRITGDGLLIRLRPRDPVGPLAKSSGFNGAQTIFLKKNIHVIMNDVGRSGILPGAAHDSQQQAGRTPLDLRADGVMQIDLPKPHMPVRIGPPVPPGPTIAQFSRNVRVLRGKLKEAPDQLDCDHLRLTLLPGDKMVKEEDEARAKAAREGTEPDGETAAAGTDEPLNGLTLRRADATGHAVWLQSRTQGMKARCNQLIYKKLAPEAPDETYLRGDTRTKLWVEKLEIPSEGPNKGQVTSITTIRTIDATIFDDGMGGAATIIARGPGLLEVQPARDKPVERSAHWQDELVQRTLVGVDKQPRKEITLTGDPKFHDVAQSTSLTAHHLIIVNLKPKPRPAAAPAGVKTEPAAPSELAKAEPGATAQGGATSDSFEIETLVAREDVRMDAPNKTMTARDELDVVFVNLPPPAAASEPNRGVPLASPVSPDSAPAKPVAPNDPKAVAAAPAPSPPKPEEPKVDVKANWVWAKILQHPSAESGPGLSLSAKPGAGGSKSEVQEVRLRGAVRFHQDPEAGKTRGTLVVGEALDMVKQSEEKSMFKVFDRIPPPLGAKPQLAEKSEKPVPLARVETEEMTIEGPVIGLDQTTDQAWVDGAGTLVQLTDRGLLTDKAVNEPPPDKTVKAKDKTPAKDKPKAKDKDKTTKTPLTIRWARAMRFYGRSTDPDDPAVAKAEFFGTVLAEMEDALLSSEEMRTYMDRAIVLARPKSEAKPADDDEYESEPEPRAQIAYIECERKGSKRPVVAISRKIDPERHFLVQQQRIEGDYLFYERATGNFLVPGAGIVYLYNREDPKEADKVTPLDEPARRPNTPATSPARRTIIPTAGPARGSAPRATNAVIGRSTTGPVTVNPRLSDRAKGSDKLKGMKAVLPLKLTQIKFRKEMRGRFGSGKETDKTERRWADFFGDVEVLNAKVDNEREKLNLDNPPSDFVFLTSQTLRVVSEPMPEGSDTPTRNFMTAWQNAQARTIDTLIQGDKITYDSLKELFYVYGEEGREVSIVQQSAIGQPYSAGGGTAAWHNRKTGESQMIDPQKVQFLDAKSGKRPLPVEPPDPNAKEKKKPKRNQIRITPRNSTERRGFTGS